MVFDWPWNTFRIDKAWQPSKYSFRMRGTQNQKWDSRWMPKHHMIHNWYGWTWTICGDGNPYQRFFSYSYIWSNPTIEYSIENSQHILNDAYLEQHDSNAFNIYANSQLFTGQFWPLTFLPCKNRLLIKLLPKLTSFDTISISKCNQKSNENNILLSERRNSFWIFIEYTREEESLCHDQWKVHFYRRSKYYLNLDLMIMIEQ